MAKIKDTDYLYISTRIKAIQRNALTRDKLMRLASAKTEEEALKVLTENGWEEVTSVESAIDKKRQNMLGLLYKYAPDRRIIDVFRLKYDYHNIKTYVKAEAQDIDASNLMTDAGTILKKRLEVILREKARGEMPQEMYKAAIDASDVLARTKDPQLSDLVLDKAMAMQMINVADETQSKFLMGYVKLYIDSCNLRVVTRANRTGKGVDYLKKAVCNGGNVSAFSLFGDVNADAVERLYGAGQLKEAAVAAAEAINNNGSMSALDQACDNALLNYLTIARLTPFGEGQIISYLLNVENELTSVRIVMAGRAAGLSEEKIMERLRVNYV